jgi:hypothetical protein
MAESHKHHKDTAGAPRSTFAEEIANYQLHTRLTDHVLAYDTQLATLANPFMIATGAIWLVLAPNTFNLPGVAVLDVDRDASLRSVWQLHHRSGMMAACRANADSGRPDLGRSWVHS